MADSIETVDLIRYQWAKGDNQGTVETVSGVENEWTLFQSGRRINTSLINEFMLPIVDGELDFNPPTPALVKAAESYKANAPIKKSVTSPIRALLDKQKKLDKYNIQVSITIELLSKEMYSLLSSSFEEDEVINELNQFIEDQIKTDTVIGMVQDSIQSLIKERYT